MKHMHFRNSCSYTSLAILLSKHNILTTDIDIAKDIKLPYYFKKDNHTFYAGGLIQGCDYFNMYLNPRGFKFIEQTYNKNDFLKSLKDQTYVMFGVIQNNRKHAVILKCFDECTNAFKIIWPDHKSKGGTREVIFTLYRLSQMLEDVVVVGQIIPSEKVDKTSEVIDHFHLSLDSIKSYEKALEDWIDQDITTPKKKYDLFYAFLVEIPEMLKLIDQMKLSDDISNLYKLLNQAINETKKHKKAFVNQIISYLEQYKKIIIEYMNIQLI